MSLFSYLTKLDDNQEVVFPAEIRGRNKAFVNHVKRGDSEYQLMFVFGGGYSGQAVYYRKQKENTGYTPIAKDIRILEEDILSLAAAFSQKGISGIKYMLGVS